MGKPLSKERMTEYQRTRRHQKRAMGIFVSDYIEPVYKKISAQSIDLANYLKWLNT